MKFIKFSYLGRACMAIDVIIDTIGVIIGVEMVYGMIKIKSRKKENV